MTGLGPKHTEAMGVLPAQSTCDGMRYRYVIIDRQYYRLVEHKFLAPRRRQPGGSVRVRRARSWFESRRGCAEYITNLLVCSVIEQAGCLPTDASISDSLAAARYPVLLA